MKLGRPSWKIVCVRGLDRAFLENEYLFDEKIEAPGKFVCVRGLDLIRVSGKISIRSMR